MMTLSPSSITDGRRNAVDVIASRKLMLANSPMYNELTTMAPAQSDLGCTRSSIQTTCDLAVHHA